jgi:hypothetical protein
VWRALTGVLPLYFGFAFLGYCLFWDSVLYRTLSYALYVQFAMINADSLLDIFYDIEHNRSLAAQLFMYIYIFSAIA